MRPYLAALFCCSLLFAQAQNGEIPLEIKTGSLNRDTGEYVTSGETRIELKDTFLLTSDSARYDPESQILTAIGDIKLDYYTSQGLVEITAQQITYHVKDRSGYLENVTAAFGDSFLFVGERLEILDGGNQFIIEGGMASTCNQPTPQWSLKIKRAIVEKEGYARIRGARFHIKDVPLLYIPYLILPAMTERRSGLLAPDTGRSDRNGAFLSQPVYWAPRQDMDFTITPTWFQDAGIKLGLESRYHTRPDLVGLMDGAYYHDDVLASLPDGKVPLEDGKPLGEDRFRLKWRHDQNALGGSFEVRVDGGSDFSVDRDFLRGTEHTRVRDYYYQARFDRYLGRNLMTLEVNRNQRILARNEEVVGASPLPELRFYQPNRHIGKGFFLRNYLYGTHYRLDDLGPQRQYNGEMMRFGLDSEISRSQDINRYIHTRWGLGYKGAFYHQTGFDDNDSVRPDKNDFRGGAFGFLETVGPRVQRTYSMGSNRIVHYLDAILVMQFGPKDVDPFLDSVALDELDIRISEQVRGFRTAWKLNSRFFAGKTGRVQPLLEIELTQDLDLEQKNDQAEPLDARFRLLNLKGFNANGIFEYNPDKGTLDTLSIYSSVSRSGWSGYGGYLRQRANSRFNRTSSDRESFIGIMKLDLNSFRSGFKISMDYNFESSEFKSQEFSYAYRGQCLELGVQYIKSPFDSRGDLSGDFFQLSINFNNLGEIGTKF